MFLFLRSTNIQIDSIASDFLNEFKSLPERQISLTNLTLYVQKVNLPNSIIHLQTTFHTVIVQFGSISDVERMYTDLYESPERSSS